MKTYFIGVDVGSGSARAGIFDVFVKKLADAKYDIKIFKPQREFVEQSSDDKDARWTFKAGKYTYGYS